MIERIYDAATDPAQWRAVISELASAVNSTTACILLQDLKQQSFRELVIHPDFPIRALSDYNNTYAGIDVLRMQIERRGTMKVYRAIDLAAPDELSRIDVYRDYYDKWGFGRFMLGYLARTDREGILIGFHRPGGKRTYTDRERQLAEAWMPHIARSIEIRRRLQKTEEARQVTSDVLELIEPAVILLDEKGRVLFCNVAARELTAAGDGLRVQRRSVTATRAEDNRVVKEAIAAALSPARARTPLAVRRARGAALRVQVSPFGKAGAMLTLNEPQPDLACLSQRLAQQHGLSPAEAKVGAALCRGYSPDSIARLGGVSVHTVRSQMKTIQEKIGTHGQTQTVAELLRGPGFVVRDDD